MERFIILVAAGLLVWLAIGQHGAVLSEAATTASLGQLAADPSHWDGRQVTVSARVIDRATVLGLGGVLIGDGSNQVLAAGWTGPAAPGEAVTVTGVYRLALAIGDFQVPMILIVNPEVKEGG